MEKTKEYTLVLDQLEEAFKRRIEKYGVTI